MKINPSNTLIHCIETIAGNITKHLEVYNLIHALNPGECSKG